MRVLVITHERSGGLSLCTWIRNELSREALHTLYHEPDMLDPEIRDIVFTKENIVVKVFPLRTEKMNIKFSELIPTFDRIICHKRDNYRDVAISMSKVDQLQIDNPNHSWHSTYNITDEWLNENENKINQYTESVKEMGDRVEEFIQYGCLNTTYESIFIGKEDIPRICDHLNIKDPIWLDILDKRHKLRNGDIGMNDLVKKRNII